MNWEEHLEWLNSETIKELDGKIADLVSKQNEKANKSMNEIHWVLALAKTNKEQIKMIEEIEKKYHDDSFKIILPWRLKNRKEKYIENPESYEKEWVEIQEFVKKLKEEDLD